MVDGGLAFKHLSQNRRAREGESKKLIKKQFCHSTHRNGQKLRLHLNICITIMSQIMPFIMASHAETSSQYLFSMSPFYVVARFSDTMSMLSMVLKVTANSEHTDTHTDARERERVRTQNTNKPKK